MLLFFFTVLSLAHESATISSTRLQNEVLLKYYSVEETRTIFIIRRPASSLIGIIYWSMRHHYNSCVILCLLGPDDVMRRTMWSVSLFTAIRFYISLRWIDEIVAITNISAPERHATITQCVHVHVQGGSQGYYNNFYMYLHLWRKLVMFFLTPCISNMY